jgi:hypothetical protein
MNEINVGSRVLTNDIIGPFVVLNIDSNFAQCLHEFIDIKVNYNISELELYPIQRPNVGFMLNFIENYPELCYPDINESGHFENNDNTLMDFFTSMIDRAIIYFKKYAYNKSLINEFYQDLKKALQSNHGSDNHGLILEKYASLLGNDYNGNIIIMIMGDQLFSFEASEFGDNSLLLGILSIVIYSIDKLQIDLALKVTDSLFYDFNLV